MSASASCVSTYQYDRPEWFGSDSRSGFARLSSAHSQRYPFRLCAVLELAWISVVYVAVSAGSESATAVWLVVAEAAVLFACNAFLLLARCYSIDRLSPDNPPL